MRRKYPRATLRKIIKGKRAINISKSADLAVSKLTCACYTKYYDPLMSGKLEEAMCYEVRLALTHSLVFISPHRCF